MSFIFAVAFIYPPAGIGLSEKSLTTRSKERVIPILPIMIDCILLDFLTNKKEGVTNR